MQRKSILIILGLVLIFSIGILVVKTKKPLILQDENALNKELIINNQQEGQTQARLNDGQNTINNFDDDEEGDDNEVISNTVVSPDTNTSSVKTEVNTSNGITLTTIANHNSRLSCWSAINGGVYDLTSWIPNHPGGENAILSLCGIDGSSVFNSKHGGSSKPINILGGFKIGTLAK